MDLFDRLLKIPKLQHSTHKILEDADFIGTIFLLTTRVIADKGMSV